MRGTPPQSISRREETNKSDASFGRSRQRWSFSLSPSFFGSDFGACFRAGPAAAVVLCSVFAWECCVWFAGAALATDVLGAAALCVAGLAVSRAGTPVAPTC